MQKVKVEDVYLNGKSKHGYHIDEKEREIYSKVRIWSNSRIALHELSSRERQALTDVLRKYSRMCNLREHVDDRKIYIVAQILAGDLDNHAPELANFIDDAVQSAATDIIYVSKLPENEGASNLLPLTLSLRMGKPINYITTTNSKLVDERTGGTGLSHGQPRRVPKNSLRAFTLFAAFPRVCRPEWIVNFGVANPKGVESRYVPFFSIYDSLSIETRKALLRYKVSFPVPKSYGYDKLQYISHGTILDFTSDGDIEINVPRSLSQFHMSGCSELLAALKEFGAAIDARVKRYIVRPGSFLAVNNHRGLHLRQEREYPDFMTLRTFVLNNLETIKYVTGQEGPVFDPTRILDHHITPE